MFTSACVFRKHPLSYTSLRGTQERVRATALQIFHLTRPTSFVKLCLKVVPLAYSVE